MLQEGVRALAGQLDVRARLQQVHLVHDVEQQVGDRVRAVGTVAEQAADVDVGEVRVGAALGGGDPDLRRRGMIVELDEETLEQLARRPRVRVPVGQPALVERQQVLVEVAGIEASPSR